MLFILFFSCYYVVKNAQKPNFLIGDWIRTNNKKGSVTYEFWKKDLTGLGFTLKSKDTTFKEVLSIVEVNDTLFLKVEGVNENPPFLNSRLKQILLLSVKTLKMSFQKK